MKYFLLLILLIITSCTHNNSVYNGKKEFVAAFLELLKNKNFETAFNNYYEPSIFDSICNKNNITKDELINLYKNSEELSNRQLLNFEKTLSLNPKQIETTLPNNKKILSYQFRYSTNIGEVSTYTIDVAKIKQRFYIMDINMVTSMSGPIGIKINE